MQVTPASSLLGGGPEDGVGVVGGSIGDQIGGFVGGTIGGGIESGVKEVIGFF
jgi:hypothetical protein